MKTLRKNGGFTLVELIVVIAILAILAGVAVPAYSGYLKKAEEAADTQVTSAINTAFAAACTENGKAPSAVIDHYDVTVASSKVTGIKHNDTSCTDDACKKIETSFGTYFEGNTNTTLKYYGSFEVDGSNFKGVKASGK